MSCSRTVDRRHTGQQRGFSLLELMVVLAIIAIVALIALPDFRSTLDASRTTSAANNLLGAFKLARSEAVLRRASVTVCPSSDQSTCSGSWSDGGVVRTNAGVVIRTIPAAGGVTIAGAAISFNGDGTSAGGSVTVDTRTVTVNPIGHSKVE